MSKSESNRTVGGGVLGEEVVLRGLPLLLLLALLLLPYLGDRLDCKHAAICRQNIAAITSSGSIALRNSPSGGSASSSSAFLLFFSFLLFFFPPATVTASAAAPSPKPKANDMSALGGGCGLRAWGYSLS